MGRNNITKKNLESIHKKKRVIIWAAAAFIIFYFIFSFLFSDLGFIKYLKMRRTYNQLDKEISRLQDENRRLKQEVKSLRSDPEYIEKIARERLGLVKEGEIVYQYNEK